MTLIIDNIADAMRRYQNMYGFHGNDYLKVLDFAGNDSNIVAVVKKMGVDTVERVPLANLNMNKFCFGFAFNPHTESGMCISKTPRRETRQGVCANLISIDSITQPPTRGYIPGANTINKENLVKSSFFVDMLQGKFNFDRERMAYRAEKAVEESLPRTHYPLSQKFSLIRSTELEVILVTYLGEYIVGKWDEDAVILNKQHIALADQLTRLHIGVK